MMSTKKIDSFLFFNDNPDGGISIYNPETREYEKLEEDEIKLIKNLNEHRVVGVDYNSTQEYIDYFTGEKMKLPLSAAPEPKSRFLPSSAENRKIIKLITYLRSCPQLEKRVDSDGLIDIWETCRDKPSKNDRIRQLMNWHAPKYAFPSTRESYHPPAEYLFDEEENEEWNKLSSEEKRGKVYPSIFSHLRHVPSYDLISQYYDRCLDLYMAPRKRKLMAMIEPEQLLESLPSIEDLEPFPISETYAVQAHHHKINGITVHPSGEILATGDEIGKIVIWEHCLLNLQHFAFSSSITSIKWVPREDLMLLSFSCKSVVNIVLVNHGCEEIAQKSKDLINSCKTDKNADIKWHHSTKKYTKISFDIKSDIQQLKWHTIGDYFLTISKKDNSQQIMVHQLSKYRSQILFEKSKHVTSVEFHSTKPWIYLMTKSHIKVFDLQSQEFILKLSSGVNLLTSLCVHMSGDHLIAGSDDYKISLFDVDSDRKPYRVIKILKSSVNYLSFHQKYPLLACAGNETTVTIVHVRVHDDIGNKTQVIPLKVLRPEGLDNTKNIIACEFNPIIPTLYAVDEGGALRMFE